jgi:Holliday junction resolvase
MSKSQRTKGAAFEREIVIALNEHGADAERNLSQSRDGGYDIDSRFGTWECKKRAKLAACLRPAENVRGVIFAQDHGERLILLRFKDAAQLMRLEYEFLRGKPIVEAP